MNRKLQIQVNKSLNTQSIENWDKKVHKDALNKLYNQPEHWETVTLESITQLADMVAQGYSVRPGIRPSGKSLKKDISHFDFIILDVDADMTINQALKLDELEEIALIHPTPSFSPELEKFRVFFVLEETLKTYSKYNKFYKFLQKIYSADNATSLGHNFFYGCHPDYKDKIYINESYNYLKMSVINVVSSTVTVSKPVKIAEVAETKIMSYERYDDYISASISDINDPNKLFFLHPHNFVEVDIDNNSILKKYAGSNPFSPTDSSKQSFVISYTKDSSLPIWYDRSNNATGGNFVEYVIQYYSHVLGQKIDFIKAVNIICEHFNIKEYKFTKPDAKPTTASSWTKYLAANDAKLTALFNDYYPERIKNIAECWDNKNRYFYFLENHSWVMGVAFKPFLLIFVSYLEDNHNELLPSDKDLTKFLKYYSTKFESLVNVYGEKLYNAPNENLNYVSFTNGYVHTSSNEFVGYVNNVYNFQGYDFKYKELETDYAEKCIKFVEDYFKLSYIDNPENAEIMFVWTVLNVLGISYKTRNNLGLIGLAGAGKTTNMEIVRLLTHTRGKAVQPSLFDENNKFGLSSLIGTRSLFINEHAGGKTVLKEMNRITGTGRPQTVAVEPKGGKSFQVTSCWSITTCTEGNITIPPNSAGALRRYILVNHTKASSPENQKLLNEYINKLYAPTQDSKSTVNPFVQDIIISIHQLCSEQVFLDKWAKVTDTETQKTLKIAISQSSSIYSEFISDFITITNDENDYITNAELVHLINQYNILYSKNADKLGIGNRCIGMFKSELETLYGWKFSAPTRKTISGVKHTVYLGISHKSKEESDF